MLTLTVFQEDYIENHMEPISLASFTFTSMCCNFCGFNVRVFEFSSFRVLWRLVVWVWFGQVDVQQVRFVVELLNKKKMQILCLLLSFSVTSAFLQGWHRESLQLTSKWVPISTTLSKKVQQSATSCRQSLQSHLATKKGQDLPPIISNEFIAKPKTRVDDEEEEENYAQFLPDRSQFTAYFQKLVKKGSEMNKSQFVQYDVVEKLLSDGEITQEDVEELWLGSVGDASGLTEDEAYELLCMVTDLPDPEEKAFLDEAFVKLAKGKDLLGFNAFLRWDDVQDMLDEEAISMEELSELWREVTGGDLNKKINRVGFGMLNRAIDDLLEEDEEDDDEEEYIDDEEEDDEEEESDSSTVSVNVWSSSFRPQSVLDQETITEFRDSFVQLTGSIDSPLTFEMFVAWQDVQDMLTAQEVTKEELLLFWREAIAFKGDAEVIDYDTFLRLNVRLEYHIINAEKDNKTGKSSLQPATPQFIVEEERRPMPRDSEMKMFTSLESDAEKDKKVDMDYIELLEKADSLLASRSFDAFDRMIGDTDDPRLLAAKRDNVLENNAPSSLSDALSNLVQLSKRHARCGIDIDSEGESMGEMRAAYQYLLDNVTPLATMADVPEIRNAMVGRWNLLFTNSEMFRFYKGVTGLSGVFPASKFLRMSLEYSSDGYLHECKYFEQLSTPLGEVTVTTYSGWDMIKEISFMTNEPSVVTRNYCQKVTAGPFNYEAEENWKSLRTMALNEVVYIDRRYLVVRNAGALRVFFVFEREE